LDDDLEETGFVPNYGADFEEEGVRIVRKMPLNQFR